MKISYSKSPIILSILPVFFFITGSLSLFRFPLPDHIDTSYLMLLSALYIVSSYLFLMDSISVLISLACTLNVILGILFLIDLFKIEYSPLTILSIVMSVAFSALINTLLLFSIRESKKSWENDAKSAVSKAMKINFWLVILFFAAMSLLFSLFFLKYSIFTSRSFIWMIAVVIAVPVINCMMLLPFFGFFGLGHLNEERMQDDLEPAFSEKLLVQFNARIEQTATVLAWIVSPIIYNKIIYFSITLLALILISLFIPYFLDIISEGNSGIIILTAAVLYFLLVVLRYQSYVLALAPVLAIILNFLFISAVCKAISWNCKLIMDATFLCSIAVTVIGIYFQTDTAIHYFRKSSMIKDGILNATAKSLYVVFSAACVLIFVMLSSVYFTAAVGSVSYQELILSGTIISASSFLVLFPAPAFLCTFFSLDQYITKPRKKKIRSIYL
ncbi:hypothetical protein C8C83_0532 [Flavobacterium sp. 90]|uniref:hypothetical protein n=1 Tax=unclassified Flavobacterium TaxID=196869 RepID=UPI000F1A83F2|nr:MULTISPECIES: hypothetical protein [unclassified Flavobacterium]RKR08936.1 hypothetical protein C8C82_0827 [Flavobacterium sp. 81]TCK52724.1 hypothetical protein C8C83_0532 [Flavobacterium sp. 90]